MNNRITADQFRKKVEVLQDVLGVKLNHNIWHNHYSVFTANGSSDQYQLICSDTARGAVAQISAVLDTLRALERIKEGGES